MLCCFVGSDAAHLRSRFEIEVLDCFRHPILISRGPSSSGRKRLACEAHVDTHENQKLYTTRVDMSSFVLVIRKCAYIGLAQPHCWHSVQVHDIVLDPLGPSHTVATKDI